MECHACGAQVIEGQKFCQECGQSLHGVTEPTERLDLAQEPAADADPQAAPLAASPPAAAPADDEPAIPVEPTTAAAPAPTEPAIPALGDLPTQEIDAREPIPRPTWAPEDVADGSDAAAASAAVAAGAAATDPPTELPASAQPMAVGDTAPELDATLAELGATPAPTDSTEVLPVSPGEQFDPLATDEVAAVGAETTVLAAADIGTTDEFPAVFDGSEDVVQFQPGREPFKLRLMFVLAFFGAVATLMSTAADITDVRTSTPVDGINIGITKLSDIGVNLPIAGFVGAAVMTLGGLLACYGFRWGAGLAGGGGLALAGWAGLTAGLAEVPIAAAESITRTNTTQQFTLTVTRDLGFWLIISAGAIGLLVFAASLRMAGTGGRRSLNPWVAAVGAVSAVILAAGPLIPEGSASFSDNFRSPTALIDLPTAYFGGRLGQVALIALAGVVGFLLVRVYGLGLVAGGISVGFWMWLSALLGIGEDLPAGDQPLGIADGNFGGDGTPHGVTTVGMVLTLLMLVVAAVLAIVQYRRESPQS